MSDPGFRGSSANLVNDNLEHSPGKLCEKPPVSFTPWILFAACAFLWVLFYLKAAPPYAGIDSFIFRDPGCAVAAGEGLVSRSVPHRADHLAPELYGAYTPGTPLLFGAAASIFGCNSSANTFYDLFFAVLISVLLLVAFFRAIYQPALRIALAAVVGLLLPSGVFFSDFDRPEIPAFCLVIALLLLWPRTREVWQRSALIGASGIVFLFHPWAGLSSMLLFGFLLLFEDGGLTISERVKAGLAGALIFGSVILACALYMQRLDPTVVHRFVRHAFGSDTGVGVVLDNGAPSGSTSRFHGFATAFLKTFHFQNSYLTGLLNIAGLCGVAVLLIYTKLRLAAGHLRLQVWLQYAGLVCITFVLPFLLFFAQQNYFALGNGFLIFTLLTGNFALARKARETSVMLALLAIVIIFTLPPLATSTLQSIETSGSYYRATAQAARVASEFKAQGIGKADILVDYFQYFLYKPYFSNLYNIRYLEPDKPTEAYKGLLLCYASQFATTPSEMKWPQELRPADWRLLDTADDSVKISVFGRPIMRRNWSWGCNAYVRK